MAINTRRPAIKQTVGAQYICFATASENDEFSGTYEADVEKTKVVKNVTVTTNGEPSDVYASGEVYDTDDTTTSQDIEVEVIAFPADTLAKMRGESVDESGLVLSGAGRTKPFFAYGKVVKKKGGHERWEWFPKCKLITNTDSASTSEGSFAEQTDTITIRAYKCGSTDDYSRYVSTEMANFPDGLTEDMFFSKPIIEVADLKKLTTPGA